mgnify:CR=1 FL=1
MLSSQTLFEMSQIGIEQISPSELASVDTIHVRQELPHEQKIMSLIEQMGNPYCFVSGDVPVRVRFVNDEKTLSQSLVSYFSQLKHK